jgi:hypothetical protein
VCDSALGNCVIHSSLCLLLSFHTIRSFDPFTFTPTAGQSFQSLNMHSFSIAQLFSLGLLVAAPLASAYVDVAGTAELTNSKRSFVVSLTLTYLRPCAYTLQQGGHIARAAAPLQARHHTEAQM